MEFLRQDVSLFLTVRLADMTTSDEYCLHNFAAVAFAAITYFNTTNEKLSYLMGKQLPLLVIILPLLHILISSEVDIFSMVK